MVMPRRGKLLITSIKEQTVVEADLPSLSVSTYVGKLNTAGSVFNGHRVDDVLLTSPIGIAVTEGRQIVYIGQPNCILSLNMSSDQVFPTFQTKMATRYLTMLPGDGGLLISTDSGVVRLMINNSSTTAVLDAETPIEGVTIGSVQKLLILDDRFYMATDRIRNR